MSDETTVDWPEWAQSDDGELVWVRADLLDRAVEIAQPALDLLDPNTVLLDAGIEEMWLDRRPEYDGGWMICGLASAPEDVPSRDYACFEATLKEYMVDGERLLPNGTYARAGGAS